MHGRDFPGILPGVFEGCLKLIVVFPQCFVILSESLLVGFPGFRVGQLGCAVCPGARFLQLPETLVVVVPSLELQVVLRVR
jgi:hypothetical protein